MQKGEVIVDITLSLKEGNENDIKALMDDLNGRRRSKQPLDKKSAGSTFKRPEGHFVGQMIEDLGLKGFSVGDAQVSEMHAGFLINSSNILLRDRFQLIPCSRGKSEVYFMASICIRKYRLSEKNNPLSILFMN